MSRRTSAAAPSGDHRSARPGWLLLVLLASLAQLGCQDKAQTYGLAPTNTLPEAMAPFGEMLAVGQTDAQSQSRQRSDTLAYEHMVSVELDKESLPTRLREVEAACAADAKNGCTILEASLLMNQDLPRGSLRMRLAPGGVESLIELSSRGGKIIARTTHAEDLAQPVADTERQLALMTTHRDRLAEFMKSKELKVEQLIAVSKELATVQTQIESLSTLRANLRRRIDTELLTINLQLPRGTYEAEQSPIKDAVKLFGSDFRQAIGQVISFVAVLLPWLVIIIPGLILLRLFWRSIGRWLARRERRGAVAA